MIGQHCRQTWSATQKSITLSSGEAELVAAVKMSTEIFGLMQLMQDWGVRMEGKVMTDSSAALGVVRRKGNGRMRPIRVGTLWVQEKEESGELTYEKVKGEKNPGDLMTKGLSQRVMEIHMQALRQTTRSGRADKGLTVSQ